MSTHHTNRSFSYSQHNRASTAHEPDHVVLQKEVELFTKKYELERK
jgi:hypothetical protein